VRITAGAKTGGGGSGSGGTSIGIARSGADLQITYTGALQSSAAVTGPWAAVANATSPYLIKASDIKGTVFYRVQ